LHDNIQIESENNSEVHLSMSRKNSRIFKKELLDELELTIRILDLDNFDNKNANVKEQTFW